MRKLVHSAPLVAFLLPAVAFAQTAPKTFGDLANQIVQILGNATTDLIVLAIVVYFWGVSSSLFKEGEKGHERLREQLIWGVVVIFFAVSIWGVVRLLQTTVFGSGINGIGGSSGSSVQTCNSLAGCQLGD